MPVNCQLRNNQKMSNDQCKRTFISTVIEDIESIDCSWPLLLVSKDQIDPLVKVWRHVIRFLLEKKSYFTTEFIICSWANRVTSRVVSLKTFTVLPWNFSGNFWRKNTVVFGKQYGWKFPEINMDEITRKCLEKSDRTTFLRDDIFIRNYRNSFPSLCCGLWVKTKIKVKVYSWRWRLTPLHRCFTFAAPKGGQLTTYLARHVNGLVSRLVSWSGCEPSTSWSSVMWSRMLIPFGHGEQVKVGSGNMQFNTTPKGRLGLEQWCTE